MRFSGEALRKTRVAISIPRGVPAFSSGHNMRTAARRTAAAAAAEQVPMATSRETEFPVIQWIRTIFGGPFD
jgi:hypothetical protein